MPARLFHSIVLLSLITGLPSAASAATTLGGHVKYFYNYSDFPDDSLFSTNSDTYQESLGNLRLKINSRLGSWRAELDYEINGLYSSNLNNCFIRAGFTGSGCRTLVSDQSQFFDLSGIISDSDNTLLYHRVDRLAISYSNEALFARAGRQAISWGNGVIYNPLDLFNPFAPAAIDKEYKRGEDMLYVQGLSATGNDLQALYIPRRDLLTGEVSSDKSALAGKYHWLQPGYELDIMLARNYGETILGAAYATEWRENIINASFTVTQADEETVWSFSANYNFSTVLREMNLGGFFEFFYNGFGLSGNRYSSDDIRGNTALFSRLLRGELFTVGRYYLSTGVRLEITPLLNLTPTLFFNLGDGSALLQLSGTYSLKQNIDLLAGLNLPVGANGTEFGGIELSDNSGLTLAPANTLFTRLAWYF